MFVDYAPCSNEGDVVEGIIAYQTLFDGRIATVVTCLTELKWQEGHRKMLYADTFASYVTEPIRQFVKHFGMLFKSEQTKKVFMTPAQYSMDCFVRKIRTFLEHKRCKFQIILSLSDKRVFTGVHEKRLGMNITIWLGRADDCYFVEATDNNLRVR